MNETVLAGKYARALFDEALKTKSLEKCLEGLERLERVLVVRPTFRHGLQHPFINLDEKMSMVRLVWGSHANPLLDRFVALLLRNQRFALFSAIVRQFRQMVDEHEGITPVQVVSAFPLSATDRQRLEKKLTAWFGGSLRLESMVDPKLLGGFIVRSREWEGDQSLHHQLQVLGRQFLQESTVN